jgi:4,5-DOPA dioxygenase extradiol
VLRFRSLLDRRTLLGVLATAPLLAVCRSEAPRGSPGVRTMSTTNSGLMPGIFLAHGAPPLLDDPQWMGELAGWAAAMPRPKAILMISAHWEKRPVTLGATTTVPLIYDFYGFPERYYTTKYPAPGAPELAARIRQLVGASERLERRTAGSTTARSCRSSRCIRAPTSRSCRCPFRRWTPRRSSRSGAHSPLRQGGVLIIGSGFLVHNLRAMRPGQPTIPSWAADFGAWAGQKLAQRDVDRSSLENPGRHGFPPTSTSSPAGRARRLPRPHRARHLPTSWATGTGRSRSGQFNSDSGATGYRLRLQVFRSQLESCQRRARESSACGL